MFIYKIIYKRCIFTFCSANITGQRPCYKLSQQLGTINKGDLIYFSKSRLHRYIPGK